MNIFDRLQPRMFDVVTSTMGYDATWQPLAGGAVQSAKVLFKSPTEIYKIIKKEELVDLRYNPEEPVCEWKHGDLSGLYESVRQGNLERIEIDGVLYFVRVCHALVDGRNYLGFLSKI